MKETQHGENTFLVTWTVTPSDIGLRLDHFLKQKYKNLSRERLQLSIKEGRVTLNHQGAKPSRILRDGDKVYVLSVRGEEPAVDLNYRVLFEDDTIIVLDKPGNLPVHPVGRFFFHTLLTQLRIVNRNEIDQSRDFFLVHRLDRETSGVLVMGKTKAAAASLVDQFFKRETEKEYLALVKGAFPTEKVTCSAPMARDVRSDIRLKMHAVSSEDRSYLGEEPLLPAETEFSLVENRGDFSLVRCRPHTGRQHQIRVHLLHLGFPILADKLYGVPEEIFYQSMQGPLSLEVAPGKRLSRHALHAHKLWLRHPRSGERMEFTCDLPEELAAFWKSC